MEDYMTRIAPVNMHHMTFFEVKKLAKALSGKTNEDLTEAIGMDAVALDRQEYQDAISSHDPVLIKAYLVRKNRSV